MKKANVRKNSDSSKATGLRDVQPYDLRKAGRATAETIQSIAALHDGLPAAIASAVEARLGISANMTTSSIERTSISEYIAASGEYSYFLTCSLNQKDLSFLLEVDPTLTCSIIDLLLGGDGRISDEHRELTELDERLLANGCDLIFYALNQIWKPFGLCVSASCSVRPASLSHALNADEIVTVLVLPVEIAESKGYVKLALPDALVETIARKQKNPETGRAHRVHRRVTPVFDCILNCSFLISADVTTAFALVKDLFGLSPGSILRLRAPVEVHAHLTTEGVPVFEGCPVRSGEVKAVQVLKRLTGSHREERFQA